MRRFLPILFAFACTFPLLSQTPADIAVPLHTSAGLNPPAVLVTWPNTQDSDVKLSRRIQGEPGSSWTVVLEEANTLQSGYYDTLVTGGHTYEYALERKTGPIQAYGYAYAAIAAPVVDDRGKILVFVDSMTADQLGADLVSFKNDLRGEGWQIVPFHTGPYTTVQWLKSQIVSLYTADPTHIKAVLLIGNIPVPYSGSTAWDNQPDHVGAWPCDAYYGDVNGLWTDVSVNMPNTARLANRNVPGDGKFDQNILPSAIEIPVGRLDFRHLSAATFGLPPVELLRRYFFKNHRWRTGQFEVPDRALVDDHLGWAGGEAFAADGFRNAYPLMESSKVVTGDFSSVSNSRYLLGFGAGTNGSYSSAGGIGTAADFAADSVNMVFTNLFGNYFGDWDYETNPLLPALLASKGTVLATGWAGRPHWLLQGLAVGESIGFCLKETQNAQYSAPYGASNGESGADISLLGDPTLRATIVKPPTNLTVKSNCTHVNLHWTASPDPEVLGYLVYRAFDQNGPYTRLTPSAVTGTAWSDNNPVADTLYYAVRAMKWEVRPGGGNFYNSSTGILKSTIFQPGTAPTVIGLGGIVDCSTQSLTLGANFQPPSATVQWYKPNGDLLNGFITSEGGVYTVIATAPNGCTAAATATVMVDTFLPQPMLAGTFVLDCSHPTAQFTVPAAFDGVHYFWNGAEVPPGEVIPITGAGAGVFLVSSTINGCSRSYLVQLVADFTPPGAEAGSDGHELDCTHSFVELHGISNDPSAQYAWSANGEIITEQNPVVILPGAYCLTVTGSNGCTSTDCINITATGEAVTLQILPSGGPCNLGGSKELGALATGGTAPFQYVWSNSATTIGTVLPAGFSGTVTLTVTDAHGCIGNASFTLAPPLAVFALKANESASGAADGSIDLWVSGGQAPYSFQWSNGSTTEDLTNLVGGVYTVIITDAEGCSVTFAIPLTTVVGIHNLLNDQNIRIAPNPAADVVGVYFQEKQSALLRLTDLAGRTIMTRRGEDLTIFLDTSNLSDGLYLLWVEVPAGRRSYKVVVEH